MSDSAPSTNADVAAVSSLMTRINRAWLEGRPDDMAPYLAESVTMTLPGFSGAVSGRESLIGGFRDFGRSALVTECQFPDPDVTVAGPVAVATYPFVVVYERDGQRWRSTGRDLWVFGRVENEWQAAWRVMLDIAEEPA
jgi:hypothetical protein